MAEAYTGTEARDFINGINSGVADGPYRQLYAHDVWDNQMNRTGRLWSQPDAVAATYNEQNRNWRWSYDAAGNLLSQNEAPDYSLQPYQAPQHRYDAAGRHVSLNSTHTRYSGTYASTFVTTNTQTYDGDSQVVRSTEQQTQSGFLVKNITSYYLRSSVLGGRTITEYDAAGARHISYTYAGGGVLTETTKTYNDAPWQQWRHTNPVTGDAVNTDTQGKQTGLTRLDPAGTNVGESDPFIDTGGGGGGGGESPVEADRVGLVPIGAGWGGGGGGSSGMRCNLDGVEIGCGWVMQMMDIGAAAQCPNNDCGPRHNPNRDGQGRGGWETLYLFHAGFSYHPLGPSARPPGPPPILRRRGDTSGAGSSGTRSNPSTGDDSEGGNDADSVIPIPVVFLLASAKTQKTTPDNITSNQDVLDMVYCLWKLGGYGVKDTERSTWITNNGGTYGSVAWPWSAESKKETWKGPLPAGTVANAHTHPNSGGVKPSTSGGNTGKGDQGTADKIGLPVYVVTRNAIWKAVPNGKNPVQVAGNDWWKPSEKAKVKCK